jgi:DNA-binding HxlR family transcriptional regulator
MASGQASVCSRFHQAVELIGARWTGAILHVLLHGPVRYADLRAAVPEISDRMLCERLRALEDAAIVVRHVSPDPPVRVDYALTDKGRALEPALTAIGRWAERWVDAPAPPSPTPPQPTRPGTSRTPRRTTTRRPTAKVRASS